MSFALLVWWVGQCPSKQSGCGTQYKCFYPKSKDFRHSGRITAHQHLLQLLFTSRPEREQNGISFWSTLRDEIALSAESYRSIIIYRIIYNIWNIWLLFSRRPANRAKWHQVLEQRAQHTILDQIGVHAWELDRYYCNSNTGLILVLFCVWWPILKIFENA